MNDALNGESQARAAIDEHRAAIDELDDKILALLNERAGHSLAIRALKPACGMELFDPSRENRIFERLESRNAGPMHAEDVHEIYAALLKVMKGIRV